MQIAFEEWEVPNFFFFVGSDVETQKMNMDDFEKEWGVWYTENILSNREASQPSVGGHHGPTFKATPAMKDALKTYKIELQDIYDAIKKKGTNVSRYFLSNQVQHK